MTAEMWLGRTVRDRRSGLVGKVIGYVEWDNHAASSLVVQPPVRPDQTVPPTTYVTESAAEIIPQANETPRLQ